MQPPSSSSPTRAFIQQQAAAALARLADDNEETRGAIAKQGGVQPLITLLQPREYDEPDDAERVHEKAVTRSPTSRPSPPRATRS